MTATGPLKLGIYLNAQHPGDDDPARRFAETLEQARLIRALGSPTQVADALVAQHQAGVTHATMRVSWPGMPQTDVLAGIELLGRAVLPEVRRRTSAGRQAAAANSR